jgi:hypothetical protein
VSFRNRSLTTYQKHEREPVVRISQPQIFLKTHAFEKAKLLTASLEKTLSLTRGGGETMNQHLDSRELRPKASSALSMINDEKVQVPHVMMTQQSTQ